MQPAAPNHDSPQRVSTAVILALAVLVPLYVAFRLPSAWTATLDAASLTDGFHHRFVVGTLLRPLALLTGFDYALFAAFSYCVLASLIGVLLVNAWRAQLLEQRLWIVAWLLLPPGAFLFNEVGYFEQVLYLLLFASMWLVKRDKLVAATVTMSIAPCVHEIAILTVLPIFGLFLLRTIRPRSAVVATAIPALVNLAVLLIPPGGTGAVDALVHHLQHSNFQLRPDALEVFTHSQTEHWGMFVIHDIVLYVRPVAYVLIAILLGLWFSDRDSWRNEGDQLPSWVLLLASCGAIAVTSLLAYAGWDGNRWRFLVICNFFLVVYLLLGGRPRAPLRASTIAILVLAALLVSRIDIWYFDRIAPRDLGYRQVSKFVRGIADGTVFRMANE